MPNNNIAAERLQDKNRPWREKKSQSLLLSDSYGRIDYWRYSERVADCGSYLEFLRLLETNKLVLQSANFCKVRLCPMCNWRKSLKNFHELSKVMDIVIAKSPNLRPVFLTLTLKNCTSDELDNTIRHMFKSWKKLTKHRSFTSQIHGWFRALEVTYNSKENTYHPHIHVIILVDKQYFKKTNAKYIDTREWVRLWRVSAGLDYDPICDIRAVKGKGHKAIAELAKYTIKPSSYLNHRTDISDMVIKTLTDALHRKQLKTYGGVMAKAFGRDAPDEENLVNINNDVIREDVAYAVEIYGWSIGAGDYVRRR